MNCNKDIHNELIELGELNCPFCDQELMEVDTCGDQELKEVDACCNKPDVISDNGIKVCKNCGQVHSYEIVKEFIDFYENMWKIRRKSVYHRKYHIENVIFKANINISRMNIDRICKVFDEIQKITPSIDASRKRMISINFIIRRLLKMLNPEITYRKIKITKSKKTLKYYNEYWESIIDLIGDKIEKIMTTKANAHACQEMNSHMEELVKSEGYI